MLLKNAQNVLLFTSIYMRVKLHWQLNGLFQKPCYHIIPQWSKQNGSSTVKLEILAEINFH